MKNVQNQEINFDKYDTRGASYHWEQISRSISRHNAAVSARYETVLAALGKATHLNVLDIGGGDGVLSYLIAQTGGRTFMIDISQPALRFGLQEITRRGLATRPSAASAYHLPFRPGSFDAAVCSDVIEHVQYPEQLLAEAQRVLAPRGRLVVTTPLRATETPLDSAHVREFFASELEELLSQYFEAVQIEAVIPLALVDLFDLHFRRLRNRPLFRYLFNFSTLYLGYNPLRTRATFRYQSLLVATARKPA